MLCLLPALLASVVATAPLPKNTPTPDRAHPPVRVDRRTGADYDALLSAPGRRVRATHPEVQALILKGVRRSRTFASLLAELDKTDVIVYVERVHNLPAVIAGRMLLVSATSHQRYVRIQLGTGGTTTDAIATLAHEMQHVIELGTSPDVRDQLSLARFYQRIGQPSVGAHTYDTVAAQNTGKRVRKELDG
jgi:hypothetical protein